MKSSCSSLITALGSAVLVVTVLTAASFAQSGGQQQSSANPAEDPANDLFIQQDFDAVKKVPNIDVKILEDDKDAVAF
jgi:hypothetical protein